MNGIPNNFISNNVNSQVVVQPWTDPYNPIWGADPKPHEDPIQNAVADIAQITPQAQEKPQSPVAEAIANITGSQDSKPEQSGIGSVIGNIFGGHTDLPTSQPQQNPIDIYNAHCPSYNNPDYHGFDPCIVK